jgi:hypothetical protein
VTWWHLQGKIHEWLCNVVCDGSISDAIMRYGTYTQGKKDTRRRRQG